jgi:hypothetical protein
MKLRHCIQIFLHCLICFLTSNCSNCNSPVCLHYEPKILSRSKSGLSEYQIQMIQSDALSHSKYANMLRQRGKQLIGEARFNNGFANFNKDAKKMAAKVGADTIVMSYRKVGKAHGDRMVLAARTDPTVGFTTTNIIGSLASSATSPYGTVYGSSTYSGTGFSTTYNPGQTLYTRQEYVYDQLEYVFSFYGN